MRNNLLNFGGIKKLTTNVYIKDEVSHILVNILGLKLHFRKKGYLNHHVIPDKLNNIHILKGETGNDCVYNLLLQNKPCMIVRFGMVEISALACYLDYKDMNGNCNFPDIMLDFMKYNAGIFSVNNEEAKRFVLETFSIIKNIDILGCYLYTNRNCPSEESFIKEYGSSNIQLVEKDSFCNSFLYPKSWTRILKNKKVLIIHPFAKTIEQQYKKREFLFKDPDILPEFEIKILKAIQGIDTDGCIETYGSWFNALEMMYREIDNIDFDIALIGAGAFGMFLANYIKLKGKQAVHIGGNLQLFFGIKGSRWNTEPYTKLYNEYWTTPDESEQIKDLSKFIQGEKNAAYW